MGRTYEFHEVVPVTHESSSLTKCVKFDFNELSTLTQSKKHVTFNSTVYERQIFDGESHLDESNESHESNRSDYLNESEESESRTSFDSESDASCYGYPQCSHDNYSVSQEKQTTNQNSIDEDLTLIEFLNSHAHHDLSRPQQATSQHYQGRRISFSPYVRRRIISPSYTRSHHRLKRNNRRADPVYRQQIRTFKQYLPHIPKHYTMLLHTSPVREYSFNMQPDRPVSSSNTASPKSRGYMSRSKTRNRRRPSSKTRTPSRDRSTSRGHQSPENEDVHIRNPRRKRYDGNITSRTFNAQRLKHKSSITDVEYDTSRKTKDISSFSTESGNDTLPTRKKSLINVSVVDSKLLTNSESRIFRDLQELSPAGQRLLASVYSTRVSTKKRNGKAVSNGDVPVQDAEQEGNVSEHLVLLNPYAHWKKMRAQCVREAKRKKIKCNLSFLLQELSKQKTLHKKKNVEKDKGGENSENTDKYEDVADVNFCQKFEKKTKKESQLNASQLIRKRKVIMRKHAKQMSVTDTIADLMEDTFPKTKTKTTSKEVFEGMIADKYDACKSNSTEKKKKRRTDLHTLQSNNSENNIHKPASRESNVSRRQKRTKSHVSKQHPDELFEAVVERISLDNLEESLKENSSGENKFIQNKRDSNTSILNTRDKFQRRGSVDNITQWPPHHSGNLHRRSSNDNACSKMARHSQKNTLSKNESKERRLRKGARSLNREGDHTNKRRKREKQFKHDTSSNTTSRLVHSTSSNIIQSKSQNVIVEEEGDDTSPPIPPLPPPKPRRRPPKGFMTFEQVMGTTVVVPVKPTEQLSWETLVNARDEFGISPVGLLRLTARRRRRHRRTTLRPLSFRNDTSRKDLLVDQNCRKRTRAMAESTQENGHRDSLQRTWGSAAFRSTSPPSKLQKRWDLVIPAYFYDKDYYYSLNGDKDSKMWSTDSEEEMVSPRKRMRFSSPNEENSSLSEYYSQDLACLYDSSLITSVSI